MNEVTRCLLQPHSGMEYSVDICGFLFNSLIRDDDTMISSLYNSISQTNIVIFLFLPLGVAYWINPSISQNRCGCDRSLILSVMYILNEIEASVSPVSNGQCITLNCYLYLTSTLRTIVYGMTHKYILTFFFSFFEAKNSMLAPNLSRFSREWIMSAYFNPKRKESL